MDQIRDFSDERNKYYCVHCGNATETRDHSPSKIFLDLPYPENLPVVGACSSCNVSFSLDEEYVACALECARFGSVDADRIARPKIKRKLQEKPKLAAALAKALLDQGNGQLAFALDRDRLGRILIKLARGHVSFENASLHVEMPTHLSINVIPNMSIEERTSFETIPILRILPEVGSRATERLLLIQNQVHSHWITVQEGLYRYCVHFHGSHEVVRIVIGEYLAGIVIWS